jgi:hypothetical protein
MPLKASNIFVIIIDKSFSISYVKTRWFLSLIFIKLATLHSKINV